MWASVVKSMIPFVGEGVSEAVTSTIAGYALSTSLNLHGWKNIKEQEEPSALQKLWELSSTKQGMVTIASSMGPDRAWLITFFHELVSLFSRSRSQGHWKCPVVGK